VLAPIIGRGLKEDLIWRRVPASPFVNEFAGNGIMEQLEALFHPNVT
jgi:hypothetical protein